MSIVRAAVVALAIGGSLLGTWNAHADELLIHGYSYHFGDTDRNNANFGLGYLVEHYAVGAYYNSYYKTTAYAALRWAPIKLDRLELGAVGGIGTGYDNKSVSLVGALTARVALSRSMGIWLLLVPIPNGVANFGLGYRW